MEYENKSELIEKFLGIHLEYFEESEEDSEGWVYVNDEQGKFEHILVQRNNTNDRIKEMAKVLLKISNKLGVEWKPSDLFQQMLYPERGSIGIGTATPSLLEQQ